MRRSRLDLHGSHRVDGVVHAPGVVRLRFHGGCGGVEYAALALGCAHVVGGEHRREVFEQPCALQSRFKVGVGLDDAIEQGIPLLASDSTISIAPGLGFAWFE